jgi:hypothetical protein
MPTIPATVESDIPLFRPIPTSGRGSAKFRNLLDEGPFGQWTIVGYLGTDKKRGTRWWCRCSCGREMAVNAYTLARGKSKSCGHSRKAAQKRRKKPRPRYAWRGKQMLVTEVARCEGVYRNTLLRAMGAGLDLDSAVNYARSARTKRGRYKESLAFRSRDSKLSDLRYSILVGLGVMQHGDRMTRELRERANGYIALMRREAQEKGRASPFDERVFV